MSLTEHRFKFVGTFRPFIDVNVQPAQRSEDVISKDGSIARLIHVIDTQHHSAGLGGEPRDKKRIDAIAHVQESTGSGSEARSHAKRLVRCTTGELHP